MRRFIGFSLLAFVKIFSHTFYRGKFNWISPHPVDAWRKARLMVFLNHTSLYEPLFMQHLRFSFLWYLVKHIHVPGADVTLDRPIVGKFWKLMLPNISSISRKKDETWTKFLASIEPDDFIAIAPEGRMKRPDGLDKYGKPMSVKGGVADIIESLEHGGMILCLSGGLHHVQKPGQTFPRLFKTIEMNLVYLDVNEYKKSFEGSPREKKIKIIHDLQNRIAKDCPKSSSSISNSSLHDGHQIPAQARDAQNQ